ncbi:MAG TPA: crossover junction endodeoxyribonuclease RuvC [Candidatus Saccharimonadales bacterium]|nr:crossover junction endodeoxyribonuclease RuvC [Candidatus Saccharimonadales bacterium]
MRVLGIDPGTGIVGFGVIESGSIKLKMLDAGVIRTPASEPDSKRLKIIADGLDEIIKHNKPDVMAVEKLFFARNVTTAMSVAQARGVVLLLGEQNNLPVFEYTPLQIKQAVTGYGKADKLQVQEMVRTILKLKNIPKPDDCADALACAITHTMTARFA